MHGWYTGLGTTQPMSNNFCKVNFAAKCRQFTTVTVFFCLTFLQINLDKTS